MGGNFREKLEEGPRIEFRGYKFHGTIDRALRNVNFELGTHGAKDGTLLCLVNPSGRENISVNPHLMYR